METLGIHIHIKMGTVGLKYTAQIRTVRLTDSKMETLGIHIHIEMGTVGLKYTAKISVEYQKYHVEYALQFNSTIFTKKDLPATAE